MVEWISGWAQGIIVAVIIATIIEMLLPEGSSKKYIKVVVGIYILFTKITSIWSEKSNFIHILYTIQKTYPFLNKFIV